jgi:dienelactone hydrolase
MLVNYLAGKLNDWAAKWDRERAGVRTPQEIEARNRFVRQKTIEMIHGLRPKSPLRAVTVKSFERDGYRVQNVLLETHPDYWVPGNLYIPTAGNGPYPGILSPCGHEVLGRMHGSFQCAHVALARAGFVVWTYEPMEEGERRHFWNPMTGKNEIGGPVTWAHALEGQLLMLIGEELTHYRIWDGMCGIDYLTSRPEVDPSRIGCTGQSGGGLYTTYLTALDSRIGCAASNEGGADNRWPIEVIPYSPLGIGDIDQEIFPAAIYGVDQADLFMAIAPRPMLITTGYFEPRFNKTADAIRARYRQLGAAEKFATLASEDPHYWTVKLRLATTDWFCRWFYNRPGPEEEPPFEPELPENLYCTVNGSMEYSQQGQTIFSLLLRKQAKFPPERPLPTAPGALGEYRRQMRSDIKKLLRLKEISSPLAPRPVVTTPRKGYRIEKLEFLSEPGIYIPTWVFIPDGYQGGKAAVVCASDEGVEEDGLEFGFLEGLVHRGNVIVAVDVRGIGATRTRHPADERQGLFRQVDDAEEVFTYWAWQMDECLFGMRVRDFLRSVDYALTRSEVDQKGVMAIGCGMGGLWVLYAAALDDRIHAAVCHQGLLSYRALTSVDRYTQETSVFVRDVLTAFDLPQVAAAAAPRRLILLEPSGPMKTPVQVPQAMTAYRWTQDVYEAASAETEFSVVSRDPAVSRADQYWNLLKA